MLAVKVDFETRQATVGVAPGENVPRDEILAALEKIGYRGDFVDRPPLE